MKNLILICVFVLFYGCAFTQNSKQFLNNKSFFTTLPCADCDGIKHFINFKDDKFCETIIYTKNKIEVEKNCGTFFKNGEILTLVEDSGITNFYKVSKNSIKKLDINRKEIEGILGIFYVYKEIDKISKGKYCNEKLCLNLDNNAMFYTFDKKSSIKSSLQNFNFGLKGVDFEIYPHDKDRIFVVSNKKILHKTIKISGFYKRAE